MRFPGSASRASRGVSSGRCPPVASSRAARLSIFGIAVVIVGLALAGCGIRLAPNFDRTMVDGLAKVNEDAMTLFAVVGSGTTRSTFPRRERTYDELIGKLDALRLQAQIRPNPQAPPGAALIFSGNASAQQRVSDAMTAPTPGIIVNMIRSVTMMRETDRKAGLLPIVVPNFKREFEISMEQALTYERALER